jgi:hypothetical protein
MVRAIVASTLFVALVLVGLAYFGAQDQVLRLFAWIDAQGGWGHCCSFLSWHWS